jgi:hypothetical protein
MSTVKAPCEGPLLDGVVKFALQSRSDFKKGDVLEKFELLESGYVASEPTVVPKQGQEGVDIAMVATHIPDVRSQ